MRATKIIPYHSILQVFQESGRPFCRFWVKRQSFRYHSVDFTHKGRTC